VKGEEVNVSGRQKTDAVKLEIRNSKSEIAFCVLSGLLLVVIQPPFSLFFLAFVALIPLFMAIEGATPRAAFLRGFLVGIVSYLGLVYWVIVAMNRYGGIPIPIAFCILLLLVLYLSLYTASFALIIVQLRNRHVLPFYVTAPMIWTMLEYLRGIMISGFPWSLLAHSQHSFLPFIQIVSITGTYFISFLIVAVNGLLFFFWRRKPVHKAYVIIITLLLTGALAYGLSATHGHQDQGQLKAALVQGNVPQDIKWNPEVIVRSLDRYASMTVEKASGTDLVIWPETALPVVFRETDEAGQAISRIAATVNADLIFGTVTKDGASKTYNSAYVTDRKGSILGRYDKVHLVPFGEFTPLSSYLPFLEAMSVAGSGFTPGRGHEPVLTRLGNIGILICYEGMFPAETNETVRNGATLLVNITNDAWFGHTSAPHQHLAAYVFRAIETDRYVLRAANTGISAVIDPQGRITSRTGLFTEGVLTGKFSTKQGQTFYVRFGDYFVILLCVAFISTIAAVAASERSRRESHRRVSLSRRAPRR
jgi:apolipoprotein N-acyltransferase